MEKFIWSNFGCFFFIAKMHESKKTGWVDFQDFRDVKYFASFSDGYDWAVVRCKEINDQYFEESV